MKKYFLQLFLLISLSIFAQQKTRFDKIDSLLVYLNQNNKFMGQICIRESGNIVFDKGYGYSNKEDKVYADVRTQYKIGNISKTFTSILISRLIMDKKLKLDTKLAKFYPKIPNANKVTIHDLLHHRSGIATFTDKENLLNTDEKIAFLEQSIAVFEPNLKLSFSNADYFLLACIVETISKKEYGLALEDGIINNINLQNTKQASEIEDTLNDTFSYTYKNKSWLKTKQIDVLQQQGYGNILSSSADLTLLFEALFSGKLLHKPALDEMVKLEQSYGKGLMTFPFGERKFYGHSGDVESFKSVVGYYPAEKTGIALLTNGDNYNQNDIMLGILSIYYKMPYQFPNLTTFEVKSDVLKKYEGVYVSKDNAFKMTIKVINNELQAIATGQSAFMLNAISANEFIFDKAGIKLTFTGNTMLLNQGQGKYEFVKE